MIDPIYILRGIAGSTAHGLAGPNSDVDVHGVFSYPTRRFWHLDSPADSIVHSSPDESYHELKKFLLLALKGNPTILETLWLDDYIEQEPYWGITLIEARRHLLSEHAVRASYGGYAHSQFQKLNERDGSFSSATRSRTAKHAKHLFRLLEQGYDLLTTGTMSIKVHDRQKYDDILQMDYEQWIVLYEIERPKFENAVSVLADRPGDAVAEVFLYEYRKAH